MSGQFLDLGIPSLEINNMFDSNPLEFRFLVCGLAVHVARLLVQSSPRRDLRSNPRQENGFTSLSALACLTGTQLDGLFPQGKIHLR